ncbi:hypothetical protein RFI_16125 [Reticulomyxa filosa]|uniref:PARG catalytic Macro domain-containing protein n=1 Tax=Reticulomyxa filosa TaxID=46433 RepID=X6N5Q3_RETFI|nr:hypothetical protein RFI_16125 [Reticulomyxa filosa]|eukprot:ETO21079.1 hypothetical protein RFI_16125 [Reticulomyxa filosa]
MQFACDAFFGMDTSERDRSWPRFEMSALFESCEKWAFHKLKCILHYFCQMAQDDIRRNKWLTSPSSLTQVRASSNASKIPSYMSSRSVLILRHKLPSQVTSYLLHHNTLPQNQGRLCNVNFFAEGSIEDSHGDVQIDFANKLIGGGVFGQGCVQEEIRFVINPECLVSLLVCEEMHANEAIAIVGTKQYSKYRGYGKTFEFVSHRNDVTPQVIVDKHANTTVRTCSCIVAIDAEKYNPQDTQNQFTVGKLRRELIKCYTGFSVPEDVCHFWPDFDEKGNFNANGNNNNGSKVAIATGNWGCGVFGGNVELKFVIQWLAASLCGCDDIEKIADGGNIGKRKRKIRELKYYAFRNSDCKYIESFVHICLKNEMTICQLWTYVVNYCELLQRHVPEESMLQSDSDINEKSLFRSIVKNYTDGLDELIPHPLLVKEITTINGGNLSNDLQTDTENPSDIPKKVSTHVETLARRKQHIMSQEF